MAEERTVADVQSAPALQPEAAEPVEDRLRDVVFFSVSGSFMSFVLHATLFAAMATVVIDMAPKAVVPPLEMRVVEKEEEKPEEEVPFELANPNDRDYELRKVVNARSLGMSLTSKPEPKSAPTPPRENLVVDELQNVAYDIPEGLELNEEVVMMGNVGEGLIQMESAMDRITWEIAQNLQESRVLVVWLIDGSASVLKQRQAIAKRLKRVYGELEALEALDQVPRREQPILTGVVGFGANTYFMTPDPTQHFNEVMEAFEKLPTDPSGVENVFTAVKQSLERFKRFSSSRGRRIMIITVTDEAGDDFGAPLETAIKVCRRYGAKAYVVGPAAVFGKRHGFIPYVAPENGKTYNLPVDLGPETAMMENVDLPFWYGGTQLRYLSSGFAPYALARLVRETGGSYFMTNMASMESFSTEGVFDHERLRGFQPEYIYGSEEQFVADISRHPLRHAVMRAAGKTDDFRKDNRFRTNWTPQLELRVNPNNFKDVASQAQNDVAHSQHWIDQLLEFFPNRAEQLLENESSPRWRMAFCLSYGRLLAQRVRCLEYNYACAALKSDLTPNDVRRKSNHWVFHPDENINYAVSEKRNAKRAKELLETVLAEAPGTPWAALAARELRDPFGIRVEHRFIPPPTPAQRAAQAAAAAARKKRVLFAPENKKKKKPSQLAPKPKPKPKLPKF
jgi:hypothetical protein